MQRREYHRVSTLIMRKFAASDRRPWLTKRVNTLTNRAQILPLASKQLRVFGLDYQAGLSANVWITGRNKQVLHSVSFVPGDGTLLLGSCAVCSRELLASLLYRTSNGREARQSSSCRVMQILLINCFLREIGLRPVILLDGRH